MFISKQYIPILCWLLFTSYWFRLYLNPQTDVVQYMSRLAVADALGCKICVMRDKKNVLDCLEDISLSERISLNFTDSCLHVLPMNKLNPKVCILNSCPILCYLQVLCQEFKQIFENRLLKKLIKFELITFTQ